MSETADFLVRFWGVRGSIACPGPDTAKFGGNTSCIEVRCGGQLLIFDAGTGIRELGASLDRNGIVEADLFLSHSHLDHISGLPFFSSVFNPENYFRIWAGHLGPDYTIRDVLQHMMTAPLFPVPLDIFRARIDYTDFDAGMTMCPGPGITLKTAPLNHPDGATGYRIEYGGKSVCYVTDTEHAEDKPDETILQLIQGADYFIYDSTYTDEEYPKFRGWGHSTWQEGVRLAEAAGVGTFVVFHHDPGHDDAFMEAVAAEAEAMRPGTIVAREGMVLTP